MLAFRTVDKKRAEVDTTVQYIVYSTMNNNILRISL